MRHDQCKRRGAEHPGNDADLAAFDRCHAAFDQPVGDVAIDQHTGGTKQERNCGHKSGTFQIEVIRCLQVARQPGQIQPRGIIDAAEAEHHSPHGFVFKQAAPFGKAQRVAANVDASGVKVRLFIGGEGRSSRLR